MNQKHKDDRQYQHNLAFILFTLIHRFFSSGLNSIRWKIWYAKDPLLRWLNEELIKAPLEPILHPSPRRVWWLGASIFSGNALFAWIWSVWLPQPHEDLGLRAFASLLGLVMMTKFVNSDPDSLLTQRVFSLVFWLVMPVFMTWMYLCNSGNAVWLATMASMALIYYLVTDWRLATLGTISGGLVSFVAFVFVANKEIQMSADVAVVHAVVFAFAWLSALILNLSSANLRRSQLANTLSTIGIMAHELRTPLSTAALLGEAIQIELRRQPDNPRAPQMKKLALKLDTLVRHMNHQIDTQIANAKLRQLPRLNERVLASRLVSDVVDNYPYLSSRHRLCVHVVVLQDFTFKSSSRQFAQVLNNLIKNAFYSLMAADSRFPVGALQIKVSASERRGKIVVKDQGMGIKPSFLPYIFKPFFSSNKNTGHGLGLAFCQQVVQSSGGTISVASEFAVGAAFTIELPIAQ